MTSKQEMVLTTLKNHGCATTSTLAFLINKTYQQILTPASIAGTIRPFIQRGMAANADNGFGKKVYWLTDYGKERLFK